MTVHLPLAFHSDVFGGARLSSLVGRDERRAPLKTPEWEANLPLDSVKFCVMFKDFVWATWGSDMKIVIEFPRKVFYSSEKSGNLATKAKKKTYKKTTLDNLPSTLNKNLHSKSTYFLKLTHQESWRSNGFLKGQSQLMHMRIRYQFLADLHVTGHACET